jgi:hypothetical protein
LIIELDRYIKEEYKEISSKNPSANKKEDGFGDDVEID